MSNNSVSFGEKLFTMTEYVGDHVILNFCFLLTSLPLFTLGASFSALYAGCVALKQDKAAVSAYFAAFKKEFKRSTLMFLLVLPIAVIICLNLLSVIAYMNKGYDGYIAPMLLSVFSLHLLFSFLNTALMFNARFEAGSFGKLLANAGRFFLSYPLRNLLGGLLAWLPLFFFLLDPVSFMTLLLFWIFLFFGCVGSFYLWLLRKPLKQLEDSVPQEEV